MRKCSRCGVDDPAFSFIEFYRASDGEHTETVCEDCDHEKLSFDFRSTGRISTALLMDAVIAGERAKQNKLGIKPTFQVLLRQYDSIKNFVNVFSDKVWFGGLKGQYDALEYRGAHARLKSCRMELYYMAGRTSVQFQHGAEFIHLVIGDGCKFGVQGISCDALTAISMVTEAIIVWGQGKLDLFPDG